MFENTYQFSNMSSPKAFRQILLAQLYMLQKCETRNMCLC